jgi:Leucine-rich repeat (LRR) protein
VGTLPEELANLSNLQSLILRHNELSGHLPSSLIQLTALTLLDVTDNRLVSNLPPLMSRLSHLEILRLGQNRLTGEWGHELFDLGQLVELNASWNDFIGNVWGERLTFEVVSLSHLEIFDVSNCALEGQMGPDPINGMTNLREFYFGGNSITGVFPKANWPPSLSIVLGENNQLSGSFPWISFVKATNLRRLDVSNNLLTSILSTTEMMDEGDQSTNRNQYAAAATLEYLNGSNNLLQSSLPDSIGQWTALTSLLLSNNQLTGALPTTLGQLLELQTLDLSRNRIQGTLPSQIANCTKLQVLSLQENDLSGILPKQFSQLSSLRKLHINRRRRLGMCFRLDFGGSQFSQTLCFAFCL